MAANATKPRRSKLLAVAKDDYVRADLCKPCGGVCCKQMPGAALPEDLGASRIEIIAEMTNRLASGRWVFDWWEGDPRKGKGKLSQAYYLRPATTGKEGRLLDPSHGGQCTFFDQEKGCTIFKTRPSGCRGLEPNDTACVERYGSKREAALAWLPFTDEIKKATR